MHSVHSIALQLHRICNGTIIPERQLMKGEADMRQICRAVFAVPLLTGVCGLAIGAAVGVTWSKPEVLPVILVKPGLMGFEPIEGNALLNPWNKSEVKPVILVKPDIKAKDTLSLLHGKRHRLLCPALPC